MSEKKLKDFLEFLNSKGGKVNCVVNSEQELSAMVESLNAICHVENSKIVTFAEKVIPNDKRKFPLNLNIKPLKEYVLPRSYSKIHIEDCSWGVLEKLNRWSSNEYQEFYHGVELDLGDPIITLEFFSEYKDENIDSTIAEYKQSLR